MRTARLLSRIGIMPHVLLRAGYSSPMNAVVFSLATDKLTGETITGQTSVSATGSWYGKSVRGEGREIILRMVCSTAFEELKEYIDEGAVLVLPPMFKRKLKEITP